MDCCGDLPEWSGFVFLVRFGNFFSCDELVDEQIGKHSVALFAAEGMPHFNGLDRGSAIFAAEADLRRVGLRRTAVQLLLEDRTRRAHFKAQRRPIDNLFVDGLDRFFALAALDWPFPP